MLPNYRGNEYGKLLLKYIEAELFSIGCKVINISIVASFQRLKEYYEELGYRYKDKVKYPTLSFEVLYMSKFEEEFNFS
nr:GNAT family N-acetyltransferase [Paenibacillus sophorae]